MKAWQAIHFKANQNQTKSVDNLILKFPKFLLYFKLFYTFYKFISLTMANVNMFKSLNDVIFSPFFYQTRFEIVFDVRTSHVIVHDQTVVVSLNYSYIDYIIREIRRW